MFERNAKRSALKSFSVVALLAALTGCAVKAPHSALSQPGSDTLSRLSSTVTEPAEQGINAQARWWEALNDAQLDRLVELALKNNQDLTAAALRLDAQLARLDVARDQRRPQGGVGANLNLSREQTTGSGLDVTRQESVSLGLSADWQLDLFGRIRAAIAQAQAQMAYQQHSHEAVMAEVVSGVVKTYTQLSGTQRQLGVLEQQLNSLQESVGTLRVRYEEGVATPLELYRAQALQHEYLARRPLLEEAAAGYRETLATLVGVTSDQLPQPVMRMALPATDSLVPAFHDPAHALMRSPDLLKAQARVEEAMALSDGAKAALYPDISVSGVIGWLSASSLDLGDTREQLGVAPHLQWSLLNLSALRAGLSAAQLEEQAVLAEYEKTLLIVLNRADRSIQTWAARTQRLDQIGRRHQFARQAFEQARARYEEGELPYIEYLDAQRDLLESEDALVGVQTDWLNAYADVYGAFPGSWVEFLMQS
ncbi:efflux transporter outer membrane subunit [Marinobacterium lacunae]|uniref:efflux transporter outer membrane subunit n=1 Tax=Marinobacterium lacunae TaxID=1232683 RepID=UPI00055BF830|nr:TolC family protein [Marinobacterium lacunae]